MGTIDGTKFLNWFYKIGKSALCACISMNIIIIIIILNSHITARREERILLGEIPDEVDFDSVQLGASHAVFEALNGGGSPDPMTGKLPRAGMRRAGSSSSSSAGGRGRDRGGVARGDGLTRIGSLLEDSAAVGDDEDEETAPDKDFTKDTLSRSWVLPMTAIPKKDALAATSAAEASESETMDVDDLIDFAPLAAGTRRAMSPNAKKSNKKTSSFTVADRVGDAVGRAREESTRQQHKLPKQTLSSTAPGAVNNVFSPQPSSRNISSAGPATGAAAAAGVRAGSDMNQASCLSEASRVSGLTAVTSDTSAQAELAKSASAPTLRPLQKDDFMMPLISSPNSAQRGVKTIGQRLSDQPGFGKFRKGKKNPHLLPQSVDSGSSWRGTPGSRGAGGEDEEGGDRGDTGASAVEIRVDRSGRVPPGSTMTGRNKRVVGIQDVAGAASSAGFLFPVLLSGSVPVLNIAPVTAASFDDLMD